MNKIRQNYYHWWTMQLFAHTHHTFMYMELTVDFIDSNSCIFTLTIHMLILWAQRADVTTAQ